MREGERTRLAETFDLLDRVGEVPPHAGKTPIFPFPRAKRGIHLCLSVFICGSYVFLPVLLP